MSQSLKYGGIHDTVTSLFLGQLRKNLIKINGLLSTLLQDTLTAYIAFPFNLSLFSLQ